MTTEIAACFVRPVMAAPIAIDPPPHDLCKPAAPIPESSLAGSRRPDADGPGRIERPGARAAAVDVNLAAVGRSMLHDLTYAENFHVYPSFARGPARARHSARSSSAKASPTKSSAIAFFRPRSVSTIPASTTSCRCRPSTISTPATIHRCRQRDISGGVFQTDHRGFRDIVWIDL